MTPEQFVTWLEGFVEGSNAYNLTPAGWDAIKAKLKEVTPAIKKSFKPLPHPSCPWIGRDIVDPLPPQHNPQPYWYQSPSVPDERFKVTCSTNTDYLPPLEKFDINEDQPFEPKRGMRERWGSCVPELDLKLETIQVEHKVRKFEKDFILPPIEDEEEQSYWKYRESLGVSPKPDVTEFYK